VLVIRNDYARGQRVVMGNLTSLTFLDLPGNQLTAVPESTGNLTALTSLDLSGNQLTAIPESIGNLTALTSLDLRSNLFVQDGS
jgi:Leucine-rich repeat (LRR) protein